MPYEFQVFAGQDRQWYWRLWSTGNSRSIAIGGEGYATEANAYRAAELVKAVAPTAPVKTLR